MIAKVPRCLPRAQASWPSSWQLKTWCHGLLVAACDSGRPFDVAWACARPSQSDRLVMREDWALAGQPFASWTRTCCAVVEDTRRADGDQVMCRARCRVAYRSSRRHAGSRAFLKAVGRAISIKRHGEDDVELEVTIMTPLLTCREAVDKPTIAHQPRLNQPHLPQPQPQPQPSLE